MRNCFVILSLQLFLLSFSSSVFAQTDLTGATITLSQSEYEYNGEPCCPTVTAIRKGTKRYNSLVAGVDYDLMYEDNVNAGEATARLNFKGDYTGVATKTFTISPIDLTTEESVVLTLDVSEVEYNGVEQKPGASELYYNNILLAPSKDYDLVYENNTNPGKATVTASFKGNYSGVKTDEFTIKDGGMVPPSSLRVNYNSGVWPTPHVEEWMTYSNFKFFQESIFPNAVAIAPQGFDVWPLDKQNVIAQGDEQTDNICGIFNLIDATNFYSSESFTAKTLSYSRQLDEGYNTCCLPFAVGSADLPEGAKMYTLDVESEGSNQLNFKPIESAAAGTPFLMVVPEACTWEVSLTDAEVEPTIPNGSGENLEFVGTYDFTEEYMFDDTNNYFGLSNSDKKFTMQKGDLTPFRAYVKVGNGNPDAALAGYDIVLTDVATGVKGVGQKEACPQNDAKFIKDGKIVILRNGMMYNLVGLQMK